MKIQKYEEEETLMKNQASRIIKKITQK